MEGRGEKGGGKREGGRGGEREREERENCMQMEDTPFTLNQVENIVNITHGICKVLRVLGQKPGEEPSNLLHFFGGICIVSRSPHIFMRKP